MLFFAHFPALAKRDGSFECTLIYPNLSSAQLACKLSGTELGDRCIEVRLESGMKRFEPEFSKGPCEPQNRTLLMRSENDQFVVSELTGVFRALELERLSGAERRHFFLVEFETVAGAVEAWKSAENAAEASRVLQLPAETLRQETIRSPIEEVMIYGVPASKLLETRASASANSSSSAGANKNSATSARTTNPRSRSRSRSRSRDRYRNRSSTASSYSRQRSRSPRREREKEEEEYRYRDRSSRDRDRDYYSRRR